MKNSLEELSTLVRGKSIALVGGYAPAIKHDGISKCDIICSAHNHAQRAGLDPQVIFSGWAAPELTTRTEIVVVNIANPESHHTIKACAISGKSTVLYDSFIYKGLNPHGPDFEWYNVFAKDLRATPFTGIAAMKFLLSLPIASLYVTGFTFYANERGEFPYRVASHHVEPQVRWFRSVLQSDSRVECDNTLNKLFPRFRAPTRIVRVRKDEHGVEWRR